MAHTCGLVSSTTALIQWRAWLRNERLAMPRRCAQLCSISGFGSSPVIRSDWRSAMASVS
jgi:hypothetical protein